MAALPVFKALANCRLCLNRGFVNAHEMPEAFNRSGLIPARAVFEQGVACTCPYGEEFARRQMEWLKPVPEGRNG